MKLSGLILLLFLTKIVNCQTITTFGGGGSGFCNGCPATASRVADPVGGTFDSSGNYYFASCLGGNIVRKISYGGIITTVAGIGTGGYSGDDSLALDAQLNGPFAVKFDSIGNMYILDGLNFRVRKVNASTGIINTIAGIGIAGYNGENIPATNAKIYAGGMCLDKYGNIYLAEYNNFRVRKIDNSGLISTIAGTGVLGSSGDGGPATNATLTPNSIAIDNNGNLFIPDPVACNIRKIDSSGVISTIGGSGSPGFIMDGIAATDASFQPVFLCFDPYDNLYISDKYNNMVFKIDNSGTFWHVAGNGVIGFSGDGGNATAATFNYPSGVANDSCGNLYITEPSNGRIRKVSFNPSCWPLENKEETANKLSIYPNPCINELYVNNNQSEVEYSLFNITGTIELNGTLRQGNNTISIKELSSGLYLLELMSDTGEKMVKKIIKN